MIDFQKLIGKRIRHLESNHIFIPISIDWNGSYFSVVADSYDTEDTAGYVFNKHFDKWFKVLDTKITNWRGELNE